MKKVVIRNNIFETNSSSSHSLVFSELDDRRASPEDCIGELIASDYYIGGPDDLLKDNVLNLSLFDDAIGSELAYTFNDFEHKLFYVILYIFKSDDAYYTPELEYTFKEALKEFFNVSDVIFPSEDFIDNVFEDYYDNIDCGVFGAITNYIIGSEISFLDFILNTKYLVLMEHD